jgi:Fur family ferric uptake transcriptional regulator
VCINFKQSQEYKDLLRVVKKRLHSHNLTFTKNKSKILEILYFNQDHISVEEIVATSKKMDEKIPMTTAYRVVSELETFGIIESIVIDDTKRYELSYLKKPHYHIYCNECHSVSEFENEEIHQKFLDELKLQNFQATNFNVIISGVCEKCQKLH